MPAQKLYMLGESMEEAVAGWSYTSLDEAIQTAKHLGPNTIVYEFVATGKEI